MYPVVENSEFQTKAVPPPSGAREYAILLPLLANSGISAQIISPTLSLVPKSTVAKVFSVAGWFYFTNLSGRHALVTHWYFGTQAGWIWETNATNMRFFCNSGQGLTSPASLTLTTDVWWFLAFTWDATNMRFYYAAPGDPSVTKETFSNSTAYTENNNARYRIGHYPITNPSINNLGGRVAEVLYSDSTLSDTDIDNLYNGGTGRQYSEMAGLGISTNLLSYVGAQDAAPGPPFDEHLSTSLSVVEVDPTSLVTYRVAGPGA